MIDKQGIDDGPAGGADGGNRLGSRFLGHLDAEAL
jgi:hypothetical protein